MWYPRHDWDNQQWTLSNADSKGDNTGVPGDRDFILVAKPLRGRVTVPSAISINELRNVGFAKSFLCIDDKNHILATTQGRNDNRFQPPQFLLVPVESWRFPISSRALAYKGEDSNALDYVFREPSQALKVNPYFQTDLAEVNNLAASMEKTDCGKTVEKKKRVFVADFEGYAVRAHASLPVLLFQSLVAEKDDVVELLGTNLDQRLTLTSSPSPSPSSLIDPQPIPATVFKTPPPVSSSPISTLLVSMQDYANSFELNAYHIVALTPALREMEHKGLLLPEGLLSSMGEAEGYIVMSPVDFFQHCADEMLWLDAYVEHGNNFPLLS